MASWETFASVQVKEEMNPQRWEEGTADRARPAARKECGDQQSAGHSNRGDPAAGSFSEMLTVDPAACCSCVWYHAIPPLNGGWT